MTFVAALVGCGPALEVTSSADELELFGQAHATHWQWAPNGSLGPCWENGLYDARTTLTGPFTRQDFWTVDNSRSYLESNINGTPVTVVRWFDSVGIDTLDAWKKSHRQRLDSLSALRPYWAGKGRRELIAYNWAGDGRSRNTAVTSHPRDACARSFVVHADVLPRPHHPHRRYFKLGMDLHHIIKDRATCEDTTTGAVPWTYLVVNGIECFSEEPGDCQGFAENSGFNQGVWQSYGCKVESSVIIDTDWHLVVDNRTDRQRLAKPRWFKITATAGVGHVSSAARVWIEAQ